MYILYNLSFYKKIILAISIVSFLVFLAGCNNKSSENHDNNSSSDTNTSENKENETDKKTNTSENRDATDDSNKQNKKQSDNKDQEKKIMIVMKVTNLLIKIKVI